MVKYASNKDGTINHQVQIYDDECGKRPKRGKPVDSFPYRTQNQDRKILIVSPPLTNHMICCEIQSYIDKNLYMDTSEVVRIIEKGMKKS